MQAISVNTGSFIGAVLLIAGCCIGAGMLGLPVLSSTAGFIPSVFTFIICWLFMLATGLLVLEVNLWYHHESNIVTMAEKTLGAFGKAISWFVFLFLFYSLMVTYLTASGSLLTDFIAQLTGFKLHPGIGSLLVSVPFGILIYFGTYAVDRFNRILMAGLLVSYLLLITTGFTEINFSLLDRANWSQMGLVVPAAILSFGFHNLVPSLRNYLHGDVKALKWAFVIGSAIPLLIYLVWEMLILGLVPLDEFRNALDHGKMATQALTDAVGLTWVADVAQIFAFFAIITSILGVSLSFVDFLSDGLKIKKTATGKIALICLVIVPPSIFGMLHPDIFLMALSYAGGFGAVILFGILPALMVWKGRYYQNIDSPRLVPGGKLMLLLIIVFSLFVMMTLAIY